MITDKLKIRTSIVPITTINGVGKSNLSPVKYGITPKDTGTETRPGANIRQEAILVKATKVTGDKDTRSSISNKVHVHLFYFGFKQIYFCVLLTFFFVQWGSE